MQVYATGVLPGSSRAVVVVALSSRTEPDDDVDVVDVTSFSALDGVEIKVVVVAFVGARRTVVERRYKNGGGGPPHPLPSFLPSSSITVILAVCARRS